MVLNGEIGLGIEEFGRTGSHALLDIGRLEQRTGGTGPEVRKIGTLQAVVGGNAVGDGLISGLLGAKGKRMLVFKVSTNLLLNDDTFAL